MKKVAPGHIISRQFKTGKYLYYREYGDRTKHSTGLLDTSSNRKFVEKILEKSYIDYLERKGKIIVDETAFIAIYYLQDIIQEYIKSVQNKSAKYQSSIKTTLKYLFADLNCDIREKVNVNLSSQKILVFRLELIFKERYNEYRNSGKKSNVLLRNCQKFFNWMSQNYYLDSNINLSKYKIPEQTKIIKAYNKEEINLILNAINKADRELYLLFAFMYETGTRISETLRIEITNIVFEDRIIYIPNKIKKDLIEELFLSMKAVEILKELIQLADARANNKHKVFKWVEISSSRLVRRLNKILNELGLKHEGNSTHIFRKSFITRQSEHEDINIMQFKQLTRIKDLRTAEKHYIKKNAQKLHNILDSN